MCLYPKFIKNRKYIANKKNGGQVPPLKDERIAWVPVGCTRCIECMKQRARGWQVRLMEEVKHNKNGKFVCLTFSNEEYTKLLEEAQEKTQLEGYDLDNEIAILAVRRFLERWRKKYKKSLRHWFVTELGHNGTEHLHLHGMIWTNEGLDEVERIWKYGTMWKGKRERLRDGNYYYKQYVNEATVNYMVKYMTKVDEQHKCYKQIILTSPGIGNKYTETSSAKQSEYKGANGKDTEETYRTRSGHKIAIPVYWRNKIYTEEQREQLWINKIDKDERYVMGEKITRSQSKEGSIKYYALLDYYRKRNEALGYGNDEIKWDKEQYERLRRIMKQKERQKSRSTQ